MALTPRQRQARRLWKMRAIGLGDALTLSITAPAAWYYLTSASPYDIGSTLSVADADDAGGDYTVAITLTGGGTLTLAQTTGLTGSGDGTSSLSYTGSTTAINAALDGADIAGLSDETATMSITLTRDADSVATSKSVSITAYPALAISTLAPADNATGVAYNRSTYTATFSRNIQAGTGNVVLKLVGGAALETFNIATGAGDQGGTVTINGADLIIAPGVTLSASTAHAIQIASTAIDGAQIGTGDSFAGIADDTTWSFTVSDAIVLSTTIATRQAFQRGRSNVVLSGTYPAAIGIPSGMEWRVGNGDWVAFASETIGSGSWEGTLAIPANYVAQGTLEIRGVGYGAPPASVANITVTDIIGVIGQSNINQATNTQSFSSTNWGWTHKDAANAWANQTADWNGGLVGSFGPAFAEAIDVYGDIPPATHVIAQSDGTGFANNNWNPGDTLYETFNTRVAAEIAKTGGYRAIMCVFGEADSTSDISVASWKSAVDAFLDDIITDNPELANTKFLWPVLGEHGGDGIDAVRQGVIEVAAEDGRSIIGPNLLGFDWGDGTHYGTEGGSIDTAAANAQLDKIGALYYRAAFEQTPEPPTITSVVVGTGADAAKVTITFDRAMENHTDATGWSVTDATGAKTVSSAAQGVSTSEVVLTCSVALYGAVTVDFGLGNSSVGATLQEATAVAGAKFAPKWTDGYAATGTGVGAAPVNTVAPALSGTQSVGNTLTCSTGTWTGVPTPTYTYQWYNNDVALSGATNNTYTLQATDEGDTIHCEVTATNAVGSATQASNDSGAIAGSETVIFLYADDGTSAGLVAEFSAFTTGVTDSDGGSNAISWTDNSAGTVGPSRIRTGAETFNNGQNIVRFKAKTTSSNAANMWLQIYFGNVSVTHYQCINITNDATSDAARVGTDSSGGSVWSSVSVTSLGSGWFEFVGTADITGADVAGNLIIAMGDADNDGTVNRQGDNTVAIYNIQVGYVP